MWKEQTKKRDWKTTAKLNRQTKSLSPDTNSHTHSHSHTHTYKYKYHCQKC